MNTAVIRGTMVERINAWWEDLSRLKLIVTILSFAFTIGGTYAVLSYKVDASERSAQIAVQQLQSTQDKVTIMATDVAVIREKQDNSIKKIDSMESKLDAVVSELIRSRK